MERKYPIALLIAAALGATASLAYADEKEGSASAKVGGVVTRTSSAVGHGLKRAGEAVAHGVEKTGEALHHVAEKLGLASPGAKPAEGARKDAGRE